MAKNLIFNQSMSVSEFKAMSGMDQESKIQVLENPKNLGHFFMKDPVHNTVLGAVSSVIDSPEGITQPIISSVTPGILGADGKLTPEPGKASFFLLHQMGNSGAPIKAEF